MAIFYLVFFLFLIFSVLIVLIGHFLVYRFLIRIFRITGPSAKKILAAVFVFLSFSFILSMFLAHFFDNAFSRAFFHFTGFWHGTMIYLLLAIFSTWLVAFTLRLFDFKSRIINVYSLSLVSFLATILIAAFSIFNARTIDVNVIKPEINHLPPAWQGRKAVQLSDVHLGMTLGEGFLDQAVEKTMALKPDIIFITGDLFDGRADELELFIPRLSRLSAPLGVYYVFGNHENYIGKEKVAETLAKTEIRLLDNEAEDVDGVDVVGISYPEERTGEIVLLAELAKILENRPKRPLILLYHEPIEITDVAESGQVDLMLSGHTHRGQLWPFNFITFVVFRGFDYGFHRIGNFNLYISSGTGVWGPRMRLGSDSEITLIQF